MNKRKIPISEFKKLCLRLVEDIRSSGQSMIITKNGVPIAEVGPLSSEDKASSSYFGSFKNKAEITGDIISPASDDWEVL